MKKIFLVACVALMIGVAGCAANSADNNSGGNAGSAAGQASSPCTQGAAVGAPIDPATVLWTPLIGMGAGLLAGLYPALRAAHTEPARALTR